MRVGGSATKGANFERATCEKLSFWITNGKRTDILERNVQSGGRFTNAEKSGKEHRGMPGDLMAAHKLAFDFLSIFSVECKHYQSLNIEAYMFDRNGKSFLSKTWELCSRQAYLETLNPMLIAKQNHKPTLLLVNYPTGIHLLGAPCIEKPRFHALHSNALMMFEFDEVLANVAATPFLEVMRNGKNSPQANANTPVRRKPLSSLCAI